MRYRPDWATKWDQGSRKQNQSNKQKSWKKKSPLCLWEVESSRNSWLCPDNLWSIRQYSFLNHWTFVHCLLFAVLGIASAEWVSLAPCVTDAKMDIMALIRQAACPASATTDPIVVMLSQVCSFLNWIWHYSLFVWSWSLYILILFKRFISPSSFR